MGLSSPIMKIILADFAESLEPSHQPVGSRYGLARKDRPVRQLIRIPKFSLFPQKIEVSHENWDQWQVP